MSAVLVAYLLACVAEAPASRAPAAEVAVAVAPSPLAEFKTRNGLYTLRARTLPETVQLSELFEVRVDVLGADGAPVQGVTLAVDATMPEHGHGMATRPETAPEPAGGFVTRGMKFHMPGNWVYSFVIEGPAGRDRAEVAVRL